MAYHDHEWGVPVHDEHRLFEFLVLEGAQAGLSWSTILAKRAAYRRACHSTGASPASLGPLAKLLNDRGSCATGSGRIGGAQCQAPARAGRARQFRRYAWRFVDGRPRQNALRRPRQVPSSTS
jgi:DNA-3-methyladenine glycosylase I